MPQLIDLKIISRPTSQNRNFLAAIASICGTKDRIRHEINELGVLLSASSDPPWIRRVQFSDQSLCCSSIDCHRVISLSVASRAILQMDQTTSAYQVVFRYIRKRCKESDLDCGDSVRIGGGDQEAAGHLGWSLHNSAGFESYPVRENAII